MESSHEDEGRDESEESGEETLEWVGFDGTVIVGEVGWREGINPRDGVYRARLQRRLVVDFSLGRAYMAMNLCPSLYDFLRVYAVEGRVGSQEKIELGPAGRVLNVRIFREKRMRRRRMLIRRQDAAKFIRFFENALALRRVRVLGEMGTERGRAGEFEE